MIGNIKDLVLEIKNLVTKARYNAFKAVNTEMLKTYFEIGRKIVEEEQKGKERAEYGEKLLEIISTELTKEFGKGYSVISLRRMRRFYSIYQIRSSLTTELEDGTPNRLHKWESVIPKLTWTHYCELIKLKDDIKRRYYETYAIQEELSVRDLKRQIYSMHYERLLSSKNKKDLIESERKGNIPAIAEDLIKDPYILNFLDLEELPNYTEKDFESKILDKLQRFLLELGQGFSFVARQKRFNIDNDNFYIDLLFYNIYLRTYIIIELKTSKFKHEDAGQMNFYLNYVKKELNKEGDNEPIGIILCTEKSKVQVEYALSGITNTLFVSKYQLYLPSKEELEREVEKLL